MCPLCPALSACERIMLLKSDANELRDYGSLLYHCGFYQQALEYMNLYKNMKVPLQSNETHAHTKK